MENLGTKSVGFAPLIGESPSVLILGSLPSVRSLQKGQYYAHERNRFWKLIAAITEEEEPIEYEEKKRMLFSHGIALWDSIRAGYRQGSLDADIADAEPNDIGKLLLSHPTIRIVCANGAKSYEIFKKANPDVPCVKLPSTSPANAAFSLERLTQVWKDALKDFLR